MFKKIKIYKYCLKNHYVTLELCVIICEYLLNKKEVYITTKK